MPRKRSRIPRIRYRRKYREWLELRDLITPSDSILDVPALNKYFEKRRGIGKILRNSSANIFSKHVKGEKVEMVDHLVVLKDSKIFHYGIHGVSGWRNGEVQFKHKGKDLEFEVIYRGKFVQRWKKKNKSRNK